MRELQAGDPQRIGPYRLVGRLGAGGMGVVFAGRSAGGRLVAVKVIRAELAADPEFRVRFGREVAASRRVSGLYTAPMVDADVDGPQPWLATAYVAGPSLADAVRSYGPLPVASVLALAAGLLEALSAIHAARLVHRDLKPSNVLLADDGPRVIDFGISRAAEATVLTQADLVLGSPGFMSPEQAQGRPAGPPSDVFSLGAVLAFAATGQEPFGTGATAALVYRVVHDAPDLQDVPAEVRPLVERCLAKEPGRRPATTELLAELDGTDLDQGWLPAPIAEALARRGEIPGMPTVTAARPDQAPGAPFGDPPPGHPPGGAARRPSRRRVRVALLVAGILAIAAASATLAVDRLGGHSADRGPSAPGISQAGRSGHASSGRPTTRASAGPTHTGTLAPSSSAPSSGLVIKVAATEECYVLLTRASDGSQIFMGVVPAGQSMTWTEKQAVNIRLGNPGGITLTVDGQLQSLKTVLPVTLSYSPQGGATPSASAGSSSGTQAG